MDCQTDVHVGNEPEQSDAGPNVVDNRRGSVSSVAAWIGEQLHDGWVHPSFAGDSNCSGVDTSHSGGKIRIVAGM